MKKIATYLPVFTGFYGTIFECDSEYLEEDEKRDILDNAGAKDVPEEDFDEVTDFDYSAWSKEYSENMVWAIHHKLESLVDGFQNIEFETLVSPKFYNFFNDSINVKIVLKSFKAFHAWLMNYLDINKLQWKEYLENRYTGRDGYIPYYSNTIEGWKEDTENYTKLDGHYLGAILDFILQNEDYDIESLYYDAEKPYYGSYVSVDKKMLERYQNAKNKINA